MGPFPETIRGFRYFFVAICDITSYTWVIPLKAKEEAPDAIIELVEGIRNRDASVLGEKIVRVIRSDNEAIFRSGAWDRAMKQLGIVAHHSVPYTPQQNGVVERWMRTLAGGIRANLIGVDYKLACYAGEFIAYLWNLIPRRFARLSQANGLSPKEVRNRLRAGSPLVADAKGTSNVAYELDLWITASCFDLSTFVQGSPTSEPNHGPSGKEYGFESHEEDRGLNEMLDCPLVSVKSSHLRPFGISAYILTQPREQVPKLSEKARRAVFLGYSSQNSAWLFGLWARGDRTRTGWRWSEVESRSAQFSDVKISNVKEYFMNVPGEKYSEDDEVFWRDGVLVRDESAPDSEVYNDHRPPTLTDSTESTRAAKPLKGKDLEVTVEGGSGLKAHPGVFPDVRGGSSTSQNEATDPSLEVPSPNPVGVRVPKRGRPVGTKDS